METELVLDPKIRDWVLIPIVVVMIMRGILLEKIQRVIRAGKKQSVDIDKLRESQRVLRSQRLRANAGFIPAEGFAMRRAFMCQKELVFVKPPQTEEEAQMPSVGPKTPEEMNSMMDGMKNQVVMIMSNMVSMAWVSYFFSGFVLVKLPFNMADNFKPMLQRGIQLGSLDPSYVSSLSWYFLNLFGLRGLFSLILADNTVLDETQMMRMQAMQPAMGQPDTAKVYEKERTELEIYTHEWLVENAETRLGRVIKI
eukprot:232184_1